MPEPKPRSLRVVYDKDYYRVAAMVRDPWFKKKEAWLKERLAEVGCPLPAPPFKKYKEYLAWNDRFWKRLEEMERSPEFRMEAQRITGGKQRIPADEFRALEAFKEKFLPPMYGEVFSEILRHFKIDDHDEGFRDFMESYFFFGQKEYHVTPFSLSWRRDDRKSEPELLIKIYAHTKREDFMHHWDWIAAEQKHFFKNRTEKNREWKTFDRDLEVYTLYKKLREESESKRAWHTLRATDKWIYSELHEKYPELSLENIRTIVSRTRKRLGEI